MEIVCCWFMISLCIVEGGDEPLLTADWPIL